MADMRHAFVCGHPIIHSRSPKIHGHWIEEHRIDGTYKAVDVAPENIRDFMESIRGGRFIGGNVTIPNKETAFRQVDWRDQAATAIGAVNTLWMEDRCLCGGNTDAYGFMANLDEMAPRWDMPGAATILGAGGAARAVIYALMARGFTDIRVVNRTVERAEHLAEVFGPHLSAHPWDACGSLLVDTQLLINTTPLGMHGADEELVDLKALPSDALVTDLVYVPLDTPLLSAARKRDLQVVDGLGMLLHQAVPGFERWFGVRPQVTRALRDLIVADIERRA